MHHAHAEIKTARHVQNAFIYLVLNKPSIEFLLHFVRVK